MTLLSLALCPTARPLIAPEVIHFSQRVRVSPYRSPHSFHSVPQGQVINFTHAIFSAEVDAKLRGTAGIAVCWDRTATHFSWKSPSAGCMRLESVMGHSRSVWQIGFRDFASAAEVQRCALHWHPRLNTFLNQS